MMIILRVVLSVSFLYASALVCDIKSHGGVGDGITLDDNALAEALDECKGGGQVLFPPGRYLLSPFNLTSNMELYLDDATLLANTDFAAWPVVEPLPSYTETGPRCGAFIGGAYIVNASIRGTGTIDGQGQAWWDADEANVLPYGRGRLIEPMYCTNFTMKGVSVQDPPFWAMHPYGCDTVLFEDIIFNAPLTSPNTDGIDPDSCSNVVIRNFSATCGDDAIAIKSGKNEPGRTFSHPSYNILIEGGTVGPSSGIDIGSEMSGDVYNVTIRDVSFVGSLFAVRIKSGRGRGGVVRNITVENSVLSKVVSGLVITMHYASGGEPAPPAAESTPHIENIVYRNISGTVFSPGVFACLPESACRGLHMQDVTLSSPLGEKLGNYFCERAFGSTDGVVEPQPCF